MQFSVAFVLAALPFLALASPVAVPKEGLAIPIQKRGGVLPAGTPVDIPKLKAQLAQLIGKYDRTFSHFELNTGAPHPLAAARKAKSATSSASVVAARSTGSESLTDAQEELWYGSIKIGTPATTYTIDFDTGSSDLFVPASTCSSCGSHTKYNPSKSSTSKALNKSFKLQYGDGSTTSGKQYTDTVSVAGLSVKSQTLGSATQYSSSFQTGPTDGLMGLAYPQISSYGATPYFNSLINAGTVSAGQFAFYLSQSGSELYLGGTDKSKYSGSISWNSVTQQGYWQVNVDSVNVNGQDAVDSLSGIVDSGTTLIVGDDDSVAQFYQAVPGSQDASETVGSGFYTFPCDSVPEVSVTFNGKSYAISADNFNLGPVQDGSSDCVGAVTGGNDGFWIYGDAFMKNVYTVFDFDNNRVGFAKLA